MKPIKYILLLAVLASCVSLRPTTVAQAAADTVYLTYTSGTAGAQIVDIYQEIGGATSVNEKWARWRLKQYTGGNTAWEVTDPSYGRTGTIALETTRANFTYVNGTGDTGTCTTWCDYAIGSITGKRRDAKTSYSQYSAYATYTATADYDEAFLGVHNNASVNGIIRVKINDVVATTGWHLDTNGEYDEAAHGTDNVNVAWVHIDSDITTGDVIKIEAKGDTLNDRHVITGLRFVNDNSANPGDAEWNYVQSNYLTNTASSQPIALFGHVGAQSDANMFGVAHINHEYNGAITLVLDGTTYTLGGNLVVGQTVSGTLLTATATSTAYGNTQTTDDFGTLTRTFTWQNNVHTQSWSLAFSAGYTATTVYASMWPTDNSVYKVFRYADMGSNLHALLPNGVSSGGNEYVSTGAATSNSFYGGNANVKVTFATTATVTSNFLWVVDANYHKSYFRIGSWEKAWSNGETMGGHTTTITLDYQTPASVTWTGKTLFVPKPMTISTATELLPFNGNGLVVKTRANGTAALTFSGVSPTKNYFTSGHDDGIGTEESYNSSGTPAKGNWPGVTVSGDASASYNIFNYATTGLTLSANANAYNNSFNQNTTGMNAASGSTVRNNALANTTTYTTGDGDFDYNCFSGNTETNGVAGDPSFTSAAGGDLTLQSSSPCINVGSNLGVTYQSAISPASVWPTSLTTINQSLRGAGWEIGAYIYPVPQAATIGAGSGLSASSIRWSFTDNADDEVGFRLYDGTDTLITSSAAADLTYLDETGLSENTQYSGRYTIVYNTYGNAVASSAAAATYTLAAIPTTLAVTASTKDSLTLSVDALPNDTSGSSGYYFSRTGANSGWIQTNAWQDTRLGCGVPYLYSIKYRNGNSVESDTISLTGTTDACGSSSVGSSGVTATTYALTLTAPQGGEHVVAGETSTITWTTGGTGSIGNVDIWYSLDNGATYLLIADNADNTGSYDWQTPEIDSENVSVKVEATDLVSVLASSVSSSFRISQPTDGTSASPETSEIIYGVSPFDGSIEEIHPLSSGAYFRGSDYDTVYLLTGDGVRRPFINESIFFTWQEDFSSVLTVSNATLAYYTLGAPMLPNPGVVLIKIQSDPKVYAVEEDPNDSSKVVIRHIISEATAVTVYGTDWADYVIDLPPTLFAHFTKGTQITDAVGIDVTLMQRRTELGS